jgi:multidrug resistance efflux pump
MTATEESAKRWAKAWKKAAKLNHWGWTSYCSAGANQQKVLRTRAEAAEKRAELAEQEWAENIKIVNRLGSRAESAEALLREARGLLEQVVIIGLDSPVYHFLAKMAAREGT